MSLVQDCVEITPEQAKQPLSDRLLQERIKSFDRWFIHTNFGNGIVAKSTSWPDADDHSWHMGVSKFEFIVRRNLPDLQGKRILELGCNAGVVSIHMSRLGAAEIVGVDCEQGWPRWREQAELFKEVAEWRCKTKYRVRYLECDMRDVPSLGLGQFDAVIALNCIYYIQPEEIHRLTRDLSRMSDCFLVQCNTRDHRSLFPQCAPPFIRDAMKKNGFPHVHVDWPRDLPWKGVWPVRYSRPVVVGRRSADSM